MIRKLIVGNGRTEREVLVVSHLLVGRDPACHISEPDPLLSRRHAEILSGTHGVSVRDLDSRNGVLVNGEKTREQVLFPGDVVQMGHLLLRYVEEVSDAEPVDRRRDRRASASDDGPQPSPFERFSLDQEVPGRWTKEPTPMPGRGPLSNDTPSPRLKSITPLPRGRAAYEEATGIRPPEPPVPGDRRRRPTDAPADDIEGDDPDATMLAPPGGLEPDGIVYVRETRARRSGDAPGDVTMAPGDSTFADAVARLASVVKPAGAPTTPLGDARLSVDAELRVLDATPACAALLGIPRESLVGDSLSDVFLRGVRRAYADDGATLSFNVTRGAAGVIVVTMTMTGGGETT